MSAAATPAARLERRAGPTGTQLRVMLGHAGDAESVQAALALGFSSALSYDAGLACDEHDGALLLTRWIDAAEGAAAVGEAEVALLVQWAAWRAQMRAPARQAAAQAIAGQERRQQQRLRALLGRTTP